MPVSSLKVLLRKVDSGCLRCPSLKNEGMTGGQRGVGKPIRNSLFHEMLCIISPLLNGRFYAKLWSILTQFNTVLLSSHSYYPQSKVFVKR